MKPRNIVAVVMCIIAGVLLMCVVFDFYRPITLISALALIFGSAIVEE